MRKKKVSELDIGDIVYDINDGITQSILGDFLQCRRRCLLNLCGYKPIITKKTIGFGLIMHRLLELLYTDPTLTTQELRQFILSDRNFSDCNIEELEVSLSLALICLEHYKAIYRNELERRIVKAELEFDVDFKGFRLRGKRDGLVKIGKSIWLLETKTKSVYDERLKEQLIHNFQVNYYLLATALESKKVKGCLYNIILRPQQRQRKNERWDEYLNRVKGDIASNKSKYFIRFELAIPDQSLKEFTYYLTTILNEFKGWLAGKSPTYHNPFACQTGYYYCNYFDACLSDSLSMLVKSRPMSELSNGEE